MKKDIIDVAIKGGWDKKRALFNPNDASYSMEKMWLDSEFWKGIAKESGWGTTGLFRSCLCGKHGNKPHEVMEWETNANMFLDTYLTEGEEVAVEWLNNLISQ